MVEDRTDWITSLTFDDEAVFDTEFDDDLDFNTDLSEAVVVSEKDHRQLDHRDAPEQHPISAITDLAGELAVRPFERLTNADIANIMNM